MSAEGMATSASWTLWKRLPPRYQLSVRTFVDEDDLDRYSPPGSPKQKRRGSPRQPRTESKSPRHSQASSPTPGKTRSIQNIPDLPENHCSEERPSSPSGSFFPFRRSGYIDHFKTQQRVNSARVMMATENRSRSPSPTGRITKTPSDTKSNADSVIRCSSAKSHITEIQPTTKRCKHQKDSHSTNVNEMYPQYSNKIEQRKYLVRETDEGTMYIDRGKVIYFRRYKSSPVSQASYLSRYNDGGYLASIRREYLIKPRLLAMGPKRNIKDESQVHEERENYNRKVGHILDYYSYPDEDNISIDDLTKYTSSGKRMNSPRKQINMTGRNVKRIYFAYPNSEQESRPLPVPDLQTDPGLYFKVNKQSKLHDRTFYLKTPGHKSSFREADILDCTCGMCRIEMQLAIMAQAEAKKEAKFKQARNFNAKFPEKTNSNVYDKKSIADNELKLNLKSEFASNNQDDFNSAMTSPYPTSTNNEENKNEKTMTVKDGKQEQTLTVTIPKMETNREISEVARENEAVVDMVEPCN